MHEIIGKGVGQLHDDISEVEGGNIIIGVFFAPKLYVLEIVGYSKNEGE